MTSAEVIPAVVLKRKAVDLELPPTKAETPR
jgi:hypothetical protein